MSDTVPPGGPRRASGGPVLQDDVTAALTEAFFTELAAVGYGRLSLEAVAKRAGAGKAAIYRRWPAKREMTVALVSQVATRSIKVADTGTLRGDLRAFLQDAIDALGHPLARRIVPDLLAETMRDEELSEAFAKSIREPRRHNAAQLLRRAADRGELPEDFDLEVGLDLLAGPLYWRVAVVQLPTREEYVERLIDHIVRSLRGHCPK
ncbi:TetR-like C-terminal domain-containing protein [Amycolatopsis sp. cmx-4-61]|uniref:TetR-like C-terminal domain-containing protein n=1 Tax=Amycolatopsis sp. cmx-4-61 TaxID=2790937 RepID=UPI00397A2A5F